MTASGQAAAQNLPAEIAAGSPASPTLHFPDEPIARKQVWRQAVLGGDTIETVAAGDGGVADWLWDRWRSLETTGADEALLRSIVLGYRRELWLWLVGDRTWVQCCSGLIGRIGRRLPS